MLNHTVDNIDFTYSFSKRKTASLFVERNGAISLIAPDHLEIGKIEDLIREKKSWIFKSIAEWKDLNATRVAREFVNGEGFLYLGRTYRLRISEAMKNKLVLKDGQFLIAKDYLKQSFQFFKAFYREKGLEKIPKRVTYFKEKMGVAPNEVKIVELGNRWASCTPGRNVNFHWKCMMAPLTVLDYIVVHELAHLLYPNHTQNFWNEVDKVMPDYRERMEWLRFNGASLDIIAPKNTPHLS